MRAAGRWPCRPGFKSRQGTAMCFPLVYCDAFKYKWDFLVGYITAVVQVVQHRELQVVGPAGQGLIPGKGRLRGFLLRIVIKWDFPSGL